MKKSPKVSYCEYGEGKMLLFAFHGYGMEGSLFEALSESLVKHYRIIGFELPFHPKGPDGDADWLQNVQGSIRKIAADSEATSFSLAGYSIGSKIALYLAAEFSSQLNELFLFAPYGLETHKGLHFVSAGWGNTLFRWLVSTRLPISIMRLVTWLGVIDDIHFAILKRELGSREKRLDLCNSLNMVGKIEFAPKEVIDRLNDEEVQLIIVYGKHDVIFSYHDRNRKLLELIVKKQIYSVDEGHWLVTEKLDQLLTSKNETV